MSLKNKIQPTKGILIKQVSILTSCYDFLLLRRKGFNQIKLQMVKSYDFLRICVFLVAFVLFDFLSIMLFFCFLNVFNIHLIHLKVYAMTQKILILLVMYARKIKFIQNLSVNRLTYGTCLVL